MIDMLLGAVYEWFHFVVVCELWLFYPIFFNELADDDDDCIIMGFFYNMKDIIIFRRFNFFYNMNSTKIIKKSFIQI